MIVEGQDLREGDLIHRFVRRPELTDDELSHPWIIVDAPHVMPEDTGYMTARAFYAIPFGSSRWSTWSFRADELFEVTR